MSPADNRKHVGRSLFFLSVIILMIFILRLSWLIVTDKVAGYQLSAYAKANYTSTQTIYATRGTIYDRTGVPIAVDASSYSIYVTLDQSVVDNNGIKQYAQPKDFSKLSDFLYNELQIPKKLSQSQLNSGLYQVQMGVNGNNISISKRQQIEKDAQKQGLTGIGFTAHLKRDYPNGIFSSNLIGTASLKNPGDDTSGLVGVSGIEASYDDILSGTNGSETLYKDQQGRPIPGDIISETKEQDGQNLYLTIDAPLQLYLEQLMDKSEKDSGGQQSMAVLMDAHTGEILAESQRPTFNPETMTGMNQQYYTATNLLFQSQYEPGSTMKTFTWSASMDSGHYNGNASYYRKVQLYDVEIDDWDVNESETHSFSLPSTVTFDEGLMMSSNTGASTLEMNMGNATWDNYLNRFLFGKPVRFGLGGEVYGMLPADNAPVSQVESAFGQGIDVTAIQMLRAWTSFANQGAMLEPHIVNQIVNNNNNTTLKAEPEVIGKPVSAATTDKIRNLMVQVGTNPTWGTAYMPPNGMGIPVGPLTIINGKAAAVKTGTAQIASPQGGYMDGPNDTLNSAVLMWPPENPDYIFYMTIRIPMNKWTLNYITEVANPMIAKAESRKSEMANTQVNDVTDGKVKVPNLLDQQPGPSLNQLRRLILQPEVVGNGDTIIAQSIQAGTKVSANKRILLETSGSASMPDSFGWTKSEVEQLASWYGLDISYKGSGNSVTAQSVASGQPLKKGMKIDITLGG